jgi:transposase
MAESRPLTTEQAADEAGVSYRTWARWLARWAHLRVDGVARARTRGRGGSWAIAPDLVDRWRRGELPSPYARAA